MRAARVLTILVTSGLMTACGSGADGADDPVTATEGSDDPTTTTAGSGDALGEYVTAVCGTAPRAAVDDIVPGASYDGVVGSTGSWYGDGPLCTWTAGQSSVDVGLYTAPDPGWSDHVSGGGATIDGHTVYESDQGGVVLDLEGMPIVVERFGADSRTSLSIDEATALLEHLATAATGQLELLCAQDQEAFLGRSVEPVRLSGVICFDGSVD